jgi:hypothetical protein
MREYLPTLVAAASVGLLLPVATVHAHHSFAAQYDPDKPLKLTGTITKVEWTNPHTYFYIDVQERDGNVRNWAVEGGAPNILYRAGWKPTTVKAGDALTIIGRLARNGARLANGVSFILPDGRCVFAGSSGPFGEATTNCRGAGEAPTP